MGVSCSCGAENTAQKKRRRLEQFTYRCETTMNIVDHLHRGDYLVEKQLGAGWFADVYQMRKVDEDRSIAMKIMKTENVSKAELKIWPRLHHPNILELLEVIELRDAGGYAFASPVLVSTLGKKVIAYEFTGEINAFVKIKKWMVDVLKGLEYLQEGGLAHLDIKSHNILISSEEDAVICDFSYLSTTEVPTRRYGFSLIESPPERFLTDYRSAELEGRSSDMWTFGLMVVNCLTRNSLQRTLDFHAQDWINDLYPRFFETLEVKKLHFRITQCLRHSPVEVEEAATLRNFLTMCLRLDPSSRPTAGEALRHKWIGDGTYENEPDHLWCTTNYQFA